MLHGDYQLSTGQVMPRVLFGSGMSALAEDEREDFFVAAAEAGFRGFDTADMYGTHVALGRALQRLGDDNPPFVVTKIPAALMAPERIRPACERYLDELQLERLPLLLFHSPVADPDHVKPGTSTLASCWAALEQLVDDGLVVGIGVSNAGVGAIEALIECARRPPLVNQIELHPCLAETELVARCHKHNIQVQAYSSIGVPLQVPLTHSLADKLGVTPLQLVLSWHLQLGFSPVVSTSKRDHLVEFQAPQVPLDDADLAALSQLDLGTRVAVWDHCLTGMYYGFEAWDPVDETGADARALDVTIMARQTLRPAPDPCWLYKGVQSARVPISTARRATAAMWRAANWQGTSHFVRHRPAAEIRTSVEVEQWRREGIAVVDGSTLHDDQAEFAATIERSRRFLAEHCSGDQPYELVHLDQAPTAVQEPWLALALGPVLDRVNAYCGMSMRLFEADFIASEPRFDRQVAPGHWHIDFEDYLVTKVYLYLCDVGTMNGALHYLRQTHPRGELADPAARFARNGRWDIEHLFSVFNPYLVKHVMGPAGTLAFFDARGFHSGGHVLSGSRQVLMLHYTAARSVQREMLNFADERLRRGFADRYPMSASLPADPSARAQYALAGNSGELTANLARRMSYELCPDFPLA